MECANAKGSARLLHMSVAGSVMAIGEVFDTDVLRKLLYADDKFPVLLYPETPGSPAQAMLDRAPIDERLLHDAAALRLVVLDGTWRKSRKMLYQNPSLHTLARLPLTEMGASHYVIRKAQAPDQLSTLEASCHALGHIHGDAGLFAPLLDAFDRFVAHYQQTGGKLAGLANHP